jgi:Uma2 family endonuclease
MVSTTVLTDYEIERNKPIPSFNHGSIQANLIKELVPYWNQYRVVSELSLNLLDWPSVPDLSLYPYKVLDTRTDTIKMTEPPVCAIEILSPTQSIGDLLAKANQYFQHGVQSCWIVLPGLDNIYVFSSPDTYEIFRVHETLKDEKTGISFPVRPVFE